MRNDVDGYRLNPNGGVDYLEVDHINTDGLPRGRSMRDKIAAEIGALGPGDTLEFWDADNPSLRIRYQYGDAPDVAYSRRASTTTSP